VRVRGFHRPQYDDEQLQTQIPVAYWLEILRHLLELYPQVEFESALWLPVNFDSRDDRDHDAVKWIVNKARYDQRVFRDIVRVMSTVEVRSLHFCFHFSS